VEDTASHETAYKLAQRADKANFLPDCYPARPGSVGSHFMPTSGSSD